MSIFVYYSDDYKENGGVGFVELESKCLAASFIRQRMAAAEKPNINAYRVIEGRELKVKITQIAARIDVE